MPNDTHFLAGTWALRRRAWHVHWHSHVGWWSGESTGECEIVKGFSKPSRIMRESAAGRLTILPCLFSRSAKNGWRRHQKFRPVSLHRISHLHAKRWLFTFYNDITILPCIPFLKDNHDVDKLYIYISLLSSVVTDICNPAARRWQTFEDEGKRGWRCTCYDQSCLVASWRFWILWKFILGRWTSVIVISLWRWCVAMVWGSIPLVRRCILLIGRRIYW